MIKLFSFSFLLFIVIVILFGSFSYTLLCFLLQFLPYTAFLVDDFRILYYSYSPLIIYFVFYFNLKCGFLLLLS